MESRVLKDGRYDAIIAGGGFVGKTLALGLARFAPKGFRLALVDMEAPAGGKDDARASALSAASKALLSVLGVWPALAANAQSIARIEITDSSLETASRPPILDFDNELSSGEPQAFMIENQDLAAALAQALDKEQAIDAFAPDSIDDHVCGPLAVEAKLAGGAAISAPLLIAADGKRSPARERAGIKCIAWSYPQIGIVTTVAHTKPHAGRAVQHFLPAGPFAILPLKGERSSIVWTEDKAAGTAIMALDEMGFTAELSRRFGPLLGDVSLAGPRQSFPLDFQIARSFVADRLVLAGDAAHAVHPLAGQGLNIGFRDAAALIEVVVDGARLGLDIGSPVLLERYERWRRFDSALSATAMDGLNRLFSNDSVPLRALRDFGLGVVDQLPWLKRALVQEAAGLGGTVPRLLKGERL
jgi:2-octaprenyl-6-methoxyphenol hydroxylase